MFKSSDLSEKTIKKLRLEDSSSRDEIRLHTCAYLLLCAHVLIVTPIHM